MPCYFFDTHNGKFDRDDTGTECADFEAARRQAMALLPAIAHEEIPKDGDRQAYTVMVRDETNRYVYTATLTFAGLRLIEETEAPMTSMAASPLT